MSLLSGIRVRCPCDIPESDIEAIDKVRTMLDGRYLAVDKARKCLQVFDLTGMREVLHIHPDSPAHSSTLVGRTLYYTGPSCIIAHDLEGSNPPRVFAVPHDAAPYFSSNLAVYGDELIQIYRAQLPHSAPSPRLLTLTLSNGHVRSIVIPFHITRHHMSGHDDQDSHQSPGLPSGQLRLTETGAFWVTQGFPSPFVLKLDHHAQRCTSLVKATLPQLAAYRRWAETCESAIRVKPSGTDRQWYIGGTIDPRGQVAKGRFRGLHSGHLYTQDELNNASSPRVVRIGFEGHSAAVWKENLYVLRRSSELEVAWTSLTRHALSTDGTVGPPIETVIHPLQGEMDVSMTLEVNEYYLVSIHRTDCRVYFAVFSIAPTAASYNIWRSQFARSIDSLRQIEDRLRQPDGENGSCQRLLDETASYILRSHNVDGADPGSFKFWCGPVFEMHSTNPRTSSEDVPLPVRDSHEDTKDQQKAAIDTMCDL